jgi:hypothetical protein
VFDQRLGDASKALIDPLQDGLIERFFTESQIVDLLVFTVGRTAKPFVFGRRLSASIRRMLMTVTFRFQRFWVMGNLVRR